MFGVLNEYTCIFSLQNDQFKKYGLSIVMRAEGNCRHLITFEGIELTQTCMLQNWDFGCNFLEIS